MALQTSCCGVRSTERKTKGRSQKTRARARWACAAGVEKGTPDSTDWLLDSGANQICVPVGDPALVAHDEKPATGSVVLRTVGGTVRAQRHWVRTPLGLKLGLAVPGPCPRLIPMFLVGKEGTVLWRRGDLRATYRGKRLVVATSGGVSRILAPNGPGGLEGNSTGKRPVSSRMNSTVEDASTTDTDSEPLAGAALGLPISILPGDESPCEPILPVEPTMVAYSVTRGNTHVRKRLRPKSGLLPDVLGQRVPAGTSFCGAYSAVPECRECCDFFNSGSLCFPSSCDPPVENHTDFIAASGQAVNDASELSTGLSLGPVVPVPTAWRKDDTQVKDSIVPPSHLATHSPPHPACAVCARANKLDAAHRHLPHPEEIVLPGQHLRGDTAGPLPTGLRMERYLLVIGVTGHWLRFAFPMTNKKPASVRRALLTLTWTLKRIRLALGLQGDLFAWVFESDLGSEFTGEVFQNWLADEAGVWRTVPKSRHVASVESEIRWVTAGARALLAQAGLPAHFWPYAAVSWCHNYNMRNQGYVQYLRAENVFPYEFAFGQLTWVRTPDDGVLSRAKVEDRARPAAFLGPCVDARKGVWVLVLTSDGRYATVNVVWENVIFKTLPPLREQPEFAFHHVFDDLKLVCAPGETFSKAGGGNLACLPNKVGSLKPMKATIKDNSGAVRKVTYDNSRCPGCHGSKHGHKYREYGDGERTACIFWGLDSGKLRELRSLHSKQPHEFFDRRASAAARHFRHHQNWELTKEQFRQWCTEVLEDEDESEGAPSEVAMANSGVYEGPDLMFWAAFYVAARAETRRRMTESYVERMAYAAGISSEPVTKKVKMRRILERRVEQLPEVTCAKALYRELEKQLLTDEDFQQFMWEKARAEAGTGKDVLDEIEVRGRGRVNPVDLFACAAWRRRKLADDYKLACTQLDTMATAFATRPMTKLERGSLEGFKAMKKETSTVEGKGTLGDPIRAGDADPRGTVSGLCMLSYIKGVELPTALQVFKGRLVCLGNHVNKVESGLQDFTTGDDLGFTGDVASLGAFRAVCQHAVLNGYRLRSADVKGAYLCADWPKHLPPHYFRISEQLVPLLSEELQAKIAKLGGARKILVPMLKPLYGHPLAGFMWLEEFSKFLKSQGWEPTDLKGHFVKVVEGVEMQLVAYVDDVLVAGPEHLVEELWKAMQDPDGAAYELSNVGEADRFLGVRLTHTAGEILLDSADYALATVRAFEQLFDRTVYPCKTPMENELRKQKPTPRVPDQKVQKIIGRLLWICRCTRPDLSFCASRLGSRVGSWEEDCTEQLARCMGYLLRTLRHGISFRKPPDDCEIQVCIHTDASWRGTEKSQSGVFLCLEAVSHDGSQRTILGPIDWQSKKQSIVADSTGSAELIAAHLGIRSVCRMATSIASRREWRVLLWTDNETVLSAARGTCNLDPIPKKVIEIRAGVICDAACLGLLEVGYVPTTEQAADGFTKALGRFELEAWCCQIRCWDGDTVLPEDPVHMAAMQREAPERSREDSSSNLRRNVLEGREGTPGGASRDEARSDVATVGTAASVASSRTLYLRRKRKAVSERRRAVRERCMGSELGSSGIRPMQ